MKLSKKTLAKMLVVAGGAGAFLANEYLFSGEISPEKNEKIRAITEKHYTFKAVIANHFDRDLENKTISSPFAKALGDEGICVKENDELHYSDEIWEIQKLDIILIKIDNQLHIYSYNPPAEYSLPSWMYASCGACGGG